MEKQKSAQFDQSEYMAGSQQMYGPLGIEIKYASGCWIMAIGDYSWTGKWQIS